MCALNLEGMKLRCVVVHRPCILVWLICKDAFVAGKVLPGEVNCLCGAQLCCHCILQPVPRLQTAGCAGFQEVSYDISEQPGTSRRIILCSHIDCIGWPSYKLLPGSHPH